MYIIGKDGLKSSNDRVIEVRPQIYTPDGRLLSLPPAFYPIDGMLIGMTPDYVLGGEYRVVIHPSADLPASNSAASSRMGFLIAVHEDLSTINPRTMDQIRGEILIDTLARGNT